MADEPPLESPLRRAVAAAGSQSALARKLGVTQGTVWKWLAEGKPLPAKHVLLVERETGIPKEVLRPDIYPADSDSADQPDALAPAR